MRLYRKGCHGISPRTMGAARAQGIGGAALFKKAAPRGQAGALLRI
jgi:hypothetical protein